MAHFVSAVEIRRTCRTIEHFLWMSDKKMLERRTKCPIENDEKKQNSSDHKGQQLGFMSSRSFCRHS